MLSRLMLQSSFFLLVGCFFVSCVAHQRKPNETSTGITGSQVLRPRAHSPDHLKYKEFFKLRLDFMPCQGCRLGLLRLTKSLRGVFDVHLSKQRVFCVHFDPNRTSADELFQQMRAAKFACATDPATQVPRIPPLGYVMWPQKLDMKYIAKNGQKFETKKQLVPGKITIFNYSGVGCSPCMKLDRFLIQLMHKRKDLAVRKIRLGGFREPVRAQFSPVVSGLPSLYIYSKQGTFVGVVSGNRQQKLLSLLKKLTATHP